MGIIYYILNVLQSLTVHRITNFKFRNMKNIIKKHFYVNRNWLNFFILLIGLTSFDGLYASQNQASDGITADVFDVIMGRIQSAHKSVNVATMENNTTYYLSVIQEDGSFPDIDYADNAQTDWKPIGHLDRMKSMVLAYTMTNSKYWGDTTVYNTIVKMLGFWYDKHPLSTNWYQQKIACPQRMGVMLILMRSGAQPLSADLENKLINRMKSEGGKPDEPGSQGTGANKLDIATHWIYRGCLTKDTAVLSFGADQVYFPIFLTTGEGLQHDFSYQQHGNQLYVGGYGHVFVNGISSIAEYMVNTPYALSGEKLELLSKFMRNIYLPILRGKYFLYNVLGRGVSRKNGLSQSGFATVVNRMIALDPANTEEYDAAVKRLRGTESPGYGLKPSNTHFWRSDYTLHQRSGYTFDVRTASKYTCRNENGNEENLKGYFLTDGATDIAINGDEYVDIFPVWDWAKIPGVTAPSLTSIPKPAQWGQLGTSVFAGGVSDGKYGASTYWLNDNNYNINTTAKKSWFFFDNEVVCLGAGITSTASQAINTTLNQSLLQGSVITNTNGAETILSKGSHNYEGLSWVLHNGVGYIFPQGGNISITNQNQTGTWKSINTPSSDEMITKEVFKMWFNHGLKPSGGSYAYIVVPNKTTSAEMNAYSNTDIEILANTDSVQVVRHKGLNILSLIFYKAATFTEGDISIYADRGCALIVKNIGTSEVELHISDPSRVQSNITLRTQFPIIEGTKELKCTLPKYPDPYAGSTYRYVVNEETPEYISVKYKYIYAIEDSWVRDGDYANTNYGTTNTLVVKKDGDGYNREAYIKFDLQNIDINKYQNIFLALYVANSNTSIHDTQWNIGYVADNTWSEKSITWNNRPATAYIITTVPTVTAGSNIMVDITQAVLSEIKNNSKTLSLHISSITRGSDGKTDAQFYSKEGSDPLKAPQLMLQEKGESNMESSEFTAVEDAWVRDGTFANTNYGATNTLTIKKDGDGYNREVYFKFNLENTSFDEIDNVSLKLSVSYANTSIQSTSWQIIPVANTWTESTLTWTNRPSALGAVISSANGLPAGNDVLFDITEYLKSEYKKGNRVISLHVSSTTKGSDGKTDAQFYSKESSDVNKHPKLLVRFKTLASTLRSIETISEIKTNTVIYPNPVLRGDILFIDFPIQTNTAEIRIIDMSGRTQVITKDHSINSSRLPSGVFILSIKDNMNPELNESIKLMVK